MPETPTPQATEEQPRPIEQLARALGGAWWTRITTPGRDGPVVTYDAPGWMLAGAMAAPIDLERLQTEGEAVHREGGYRLELGTPLTETQLLAVGELVANVKLSHHTAPPKKG